MKHYDLTTLRKSMAAEKAAFVKAAVEFAFKSPAPIYEGSRTPTRSVLFTVKTTYEGMVKYAELAAQGWVLDDNYRYQLEKLAITAPLQFAALAPQEHFDTVLMPIIAMSAEQQYEREVIAHNKEVAKGKQEVAHREAVRKSIIAEREKELNDAVEARMRGQKISLNYDQLMATGFVDA